MASGPVNFIDLVDNFLQVESIGRSADGGFAPGQFVAIALIEQQAEVVQAHAALSDVNGGAGHEAHHFIKETVTLDGDPIAVVEGAEFGALNGAVPVHVGPLVATVGGEGVEVVAAKVVAEGFLEYGGVQ